MEKISDLVGHLNLLRYFLYMDSTHDMTLLL